jgi:tRNA pseudouridine38-40 synthase
LTVEYDGSAFSGFQWQPELRTVAGVLEEALARLFNEPVKVTGAGRTDAGVHATGQVISLETAAAFPFERLALALNATLPPDCAVRETAIVDGDFSARFSARERTYVYAILNRPARIALLSRFAWHIPQALDVAVMRAAAATAVGEHDFRAFCSLVPESSGGEPASTVRAVSRFTVEAQGELVRLEIAANGFLHRMVRSLAGTLAECGRGRGSPDAVAQMLARAQPATRPIAPAQGLDLAGVRYFDGYDSFVDPPVFGRG